MNDERSVLQSYLSIGMHDTHLAYLTAPPRHGETFPHGGEGSWFGNLGRWRDGSPFTLIPSHRLTVSTPAFISLLWC